MTTGYGDIIGRCDQCKASYVAVIEVSSTNDWWCLSCLIGEWHAGQGEKPYAKKANEKGGVPPRAGN